MSHGDRPNMSRRLIAVVMLMLIAGAMGASAAFAAEAPSVDAEYATNVASTSATFNAQIDPHGVSTDYRLEYGINGYESVVSGSVGEGSSDMLVSVHRQDLQAGATYHYRFVASSECEPGNTCTVEGPDRVITTQSANGQELTLLDGRQWELVSPADKKGALIEPVGDGQGPIQAAANGEGMEYVATETVGAGALGKGAWNPTVALRVHGGWRSVDQLAGVSLPQEGTEANELEFGGSEADLFSPDLSTGVLTSGFQQTPPGGTEPTVYLRDSASGSVVPLVTAANVEPGVKFGGSDEKDHQMSFATATPDLSYVVILSPYALVEPAVNGANNELKGQAENVYEWHAGRLQLVNILPDGKPTEGLPGAYVGRNETLTAQAISRDGRFIVWSFGLSELSSSSLYPAHIELYVRDMVAGKTLRVGGPEALFEGMSSDGSRVLYLEKGELYALETATGTSTDLTSDHGAGEATAGVQDAVVGMSSDGSYVYFVAKGVLAEGGISGEDNLYVLHDNNENGWSVTHVATLSAEDEKDWYALGNHKGSIGLGNVVSRVSEGGRFVAFMSDRSLTGYDNLDAYSGQPDEEVYLYDAQAGRLVCVSCNPTGARPSGVLDSVENAYGLLVDRARTWAQEAFVGFTNHWLGGSIPSWYEIDSSSRAVHQPRFLSDGGRVFFDSPDALVPQDTNALEDVYEYEPAGVGDCSTGSATFSERSGGCVDLVSSGTSFSESAFMDASETGDDAFFVTASKLVGADYDNAYDVYDAHVCSASVPCVSEPTVPPPCTSGDSCKPAPSPQPEIFGAAPSATFSGTGNLSEPPASIVQPRSLSRMQMLARALRACKRQKDRHKRAACVRRARKRYGVKRADAKTGKRG